MTSIQIPNPDHDMTGAASPNPSIADRSAGVFSWLRRQPVRRDGTDRWFGGVCSGVAQQLGVSATVVRAITAGLALLAGVGVGAYLFAWLMLPNRAGRILAEEALRSGRGGPVALFAVATFAVLTGVLGVPALGALALTIVGVAVLHKQVPAASHNQS